MPNASGLRYAALDLGYTRTCWLSTGKDQPTPNSATPGGRGTMLQKTKDATVHPSQNDTLFRRKKYLSGIEHACLDDNSN